MNNVSTAGNRRVVIRNAGIAFLIVMVLLTFFSKTINNLFLPEVQLSVAKKGKLSYTFEAEGKINNMNIQKVIAPGKWTVKQVYVEMGQAVKKGTPLAAIDVGDGLTEIKRKEADVEKQIDDLQAYKSKFSKYDMPELINDCDQAQKEIKKAEESLNVIKILYETGAEALVNVKDAEHKLEAAKKDYDKKKSLVSRGEEEYNFNVKEKERAIDTAKIELDNLNKKIPADGVLKADTDGQVYSVLIEEGSPCIEDQLLFEIIDGSSRDITVQWKLNSKKANKFDIGCSIDVGADVLGTMELKGKIISKEILKESNDVKFTALLDTKPLYEYNKNIESGRKNGEIKVLANGQLLKVYGAVSSDEYPILVPNSSIVSDGRQDYIYMLREEKGLLGEVKLVEKLEARVVEADDQYSAVQGTGISQGGDVVSHSSNILSDGMHVKVE